MYSLFLLLATRLNADYVIILMYDNNNIIYVQRLVLLSYAEAFIKLFFTSTHGQKAKRIVCHTSSNTTLLPINVRIRHCTPLW